MRALLSFIFILVFLGQAQSQSTEKKADQLLQNFIEKTQVPALSISVSKQGTLVYSKGFGFADGAKTIPVNPSETKFRIGSVSKTLTAAGLGKLYEEGKVDLDVPVSQYVPIWPKKKHDVSLRQLAGHLGGIRHYRGNEFFSHEHYPSVTDGLVIFKDDPLINVPGSAYSYSSYGWNLISVAMEKAAGGSTFLQSLDFLQFIEQEVFDALEMENTEADYATKDIPNRVAFYEIRNGKPQDAPHVDNSYKWAGGGFIGTTEDLCKFGQAHMQAGFLKQSTLDEWMTSQKTSDGKATNYGIGWRTFPRPNGMTFYGHSGGSVGGVTFFLIHKPSETVLAITGNLSQLNYGGLQFELMELFVNGEN